MQYYSRIVTSFFLILFGVTYGQKPSKPSSDEIFHQIQKLNFLGSVLYVAAHPDDENTRLISWLSNDKKATTTYLSLTRGDGGQNLIGPELRELLGVIRTQELIEARKIDGGKQLFSRANDFGFSKNPDETLEIWDREKVLADVVWAIRKTQPDIIINRFDHRSPGTTHGHHTASAILALEAFDISNDKSYFSNQLEFVSTWQTKRIYFNTSWWFYGSRDKFEKADKSNLAQLQIGTYYRFFGKSNQEIAALSRSSHQSQGFGNTGTRGEEIEYLELLKGDIPQNKNDIFEGIDTSWNRLKGGKEIGVILSQVENNFDFKDPSSSIPELIKAYTLITQLEDKHWRYQKIEEIKTIIANCAGLYLEAVSDVQEITPGSELNVKIEAINRSDIPIKLKGISAFSTNKEATKIIELKNNVAYKETKVIDLPKNLEYTNPYWLNQGANDGMYNVNNQDEIGKPDVTRTIKLGFEIEINSTTLSFERHVVYKFNDDVQGEVYQPLDVVPIASSSFTEKVYLFSSDKSKTVSLKIKSGRENIEGKIKLDLPPNWDVSPKEVLFSIANKNEEKQIDFLVSPPEDVQEIVIKSKIIINNETYENSKIDINYKHIYHQMVLRPSEAKAIHLKIKTRNEKIGYIMGAGDDIPYCLKQMGYEVELIKPESITSEYLQKFDVIITGIRAYNTITTLSNKQDLLLDSVKNGKTMIVQYNTTDDLVTQKIAPFPLKISRDRVTEENAEVRFLAPKHKVLNYPNQITQDDFKNWKQEQGLYYPNEWDSNFTAILSSNDKGETPKDGALLVAKYGKGNYIYTGLSFFRELPEGVTGAYKLMANLIAVGR
jgi:LmbE family N-acetylglucosaminyl deacetylase